MVEQIMRIFAETSQKPELNKATLYSLLGVDDFSDITAVTKAFRKLALIHHPDKAGDEDAFKKIGHAYFVLSDPERKKQYDDLLQSGNAEAATDFTFASNENYECEAVERLFAFGKEESRRRDREQTNISRSTLPVPNFLSVFQPAHFMKKKCYIVGKPINISARAGELRSDIPEHEIRASFLDLDNVILFQEEHDAFSYAWATRQGNFYEDPACFQSPFAKVQLLHPVNAKPFRLDYWINEKYENSTDGASKMSGSLFCLDVGMSDLEIISARIYVQTAKRDQMFKAYPGIEFPKKASAECDM